jgi:hypothetical protein
MKFWITVTCIIFGFNLLGQQELVMDIDSVIVRYVSTNLTGEEVPEDGDQGPELDVYCSITNNSNYTIGLDVLKHSICMEFMIDNKSYNSCQVSIIPDPNNQDSNYVLKPRESVQRGMPFVISGNRAS